MFSLICAWINGWVNNGEAGDFRRNRTHHDVIVMRIKISPACGAMPVWRNYRNANIYFMSPKTIPCINGSAIRHNYFWLPARWDDVFAGTPTNCQCSEIVCDSVLLCECDLLETKLCMIMLWWNSHSLWWYRWFSARLNYPQCVSSGDTAVLHYAIDIIWITLLSSQKADDDLNQFIM